MKSSTRIITLYALGLSFLTFHTYVALQARHSAQVKAQAFWTEQTQKLNIQYQQMYATKAFSATPIFSVSTPSGSPPQSLQTNTVNANNTPPFTLSSIVLDAAKSKALIDLGSGNSRWLEPQQSFDVWRLDALTPFGARFVHVPTNTKHSLKLKDTQKLPAQTSTNRRSHAFNANRPNIPLPKDPTLPPLPPMGLPKP